MKLLLDECVPRKATFLLAADGHECQTAGEAGLAGKENGELLREAEKRFDVLLTIDKNIPHQQNLSGRGRAILIAAPFRTILIGCSTGTDVSLFYAAFCC
jgi:predicted nuclease of predicted toxin-antitoxin system